RRYGKINMTHTRHRRNYREINKLTLLLVRWDPRQFCKAWHQPAFALPTETVRGRVPTASDGVRFSTSFLDEVVVEQAHGHQALLEGGVGEPDAGIESNNVRTAMIGARC